MPGKTQFPEPRNPLITSVDGSGEPLAEIDLHAGTQSAGEWITVLTKEKRKPRIIREMLGQADLYAGPILRPASIERSRKCTTRIEDQQVTGAKELA